MNDLSRIAAVYSSAEAAIWFLAAAVILRRAWRFGGSPRKIALIAGLACCVLGALCLIEYFQPLADQGDFRGSPKLIAIAVLLGCLIWHYQLASAPFSARFDPFIALAIFLIPPFSIKPTSQLHYYGVDHFEFWKAVWWLVKTAGGIGFSISGLRNKRYMLHRLAVLTGLVHIFFSSASKLSWIRLS